MIELLTDNAEKRVIFPSGKQRQFLLKAVKKSKLSWRQFADTIKVHKRTLSDWKRERYSLPLAVLQRISRITKLKIPVDIEIRQPFWSAKKAGKVAGKLVYQKYGRIGGDPEYRKKKWYEWWERVGRFNPNKYFVTKKITLPQKNTELAEFVGILLGDGSITPNQIAISLNRFDERDFVLYIESLIQKLFAVSPSIYERKRESEINIVISRAKLVQFFVEMGLCVGSKVKHQVKVPSWIKKTKKFTKSCLRGLFDTDGCFYADKHHYKDKVYYNCAMNFTSRSLPILFFFKSKLEQFGFHPTQNTKFSISLRREDEIIKYLQIIGSSNQKYLEKIKVYFNNRYGEVPKWL